MFLFNEGPTTLMGVEQEFMGLRYGSSTRNCIMYLFEGPIPTDISEIPFDLDNPYEVGLNSVGMYNPQFKNNQNLNELQLDGVRASVNPPMPAAEIKSSYLDVSRNKWRLFPKVVVNESALNDSITNGLNENNISAMYRFASSHALIGDGNPDLSVAGNTNPQYHASANRYPYNDPLIWEFDQVVTLDHMHLNQTHSGSRFDNTHMDIQTWDPTLLSGAGDWSAATRVSYAGGNTINEVAVPALTSNKFRIAAGDTSSHGWILKSWAFYSDAEPVHAPITVTWALIGTSWNGATNVSNGSAYSYTPVKINDGKHLNRLPWMVITVGDPENEGAFLLSKSTNIVGKQSIEPLSLRLRF